MNLHITGGELTGPKVHGKLRPVGADWLTIRTDGVGILDVRATIETQDEALIYSSYTGVGDLGEDGYDKFLQGDPPRLSRCGLSRVVCRPTPTISGSTDYSA